MDLLENLNSMVKTLLNSTERKCSASVDDCVYFWDILDPLVKFLLLNQTEILNVSFNISDKLTESKHYLNWTVLPENVKEILKNQHGSSYLFLTFEQWGWTKRGGQFSGATLYSMLPAKAHAVLSEMLLILAPIEYDLKINHSKLNRILEAGLSEPPNSFKYFADIFIDSFFQTIEDLFELCLRNDMKNFVKQPTVSVFLNAVMRAKKFLHLNFLKKY